MNTRLRRERGRLAEEKKLDALSRYLKMIAEPTVDEFKRNPYSLRHCFLACVATYHSIDRAAEIIGKKPATLRQIWGRKSMEFKLVDIVAHDFKHIHASDRKGPPNTIPLSFALYGTMDFNTHAFNDSGEIDRLRNLTFVVRDAIAFVHSQALSYNVP